MTSEGNKVTPPKPSRLLFWIERHGTPNQLRVDYVPTGVDTAKTVYTLTVTADSYGRKQASTEVDPAELPTKDYRYGDTDVVLDPDHAHIVRVTDAGRKRLEEWNAFQKKEARDLSEYARLKAKFGAV